MTKKLILSLDLHDEKDKKKALKAVTSLTGIGSVSVDMKEKKLTVIGEVDPVDVVAKLRKRHYFTELISVGPEKTEEKKKEEPKKDDKKKSEKDELAEIINAYKAYHPHLTTHYYVQSVEENPNACVIC